MGHHDRHLIMIYERHTLACIIHWVPKCNTHSSTLSDRTPIKLILNQIQRLEKGVVVSYHKSSQRVMVTRSDELWEVVEESYGNSFERLTITLHHPFSPPVSKAFTKERNSPCLHRFGSTTITQKGRHGRTLSMFFLTFVRLCDPR